MFLRHLIMMSEIYDLRILPNHLSIYEYILWMSITMLNFYFVASGTKVRWDVQICTPLECD